jgi:hypothetical protein
MTRDEANEYVLEILSQYENSHKAPPEGKSFAQIYNTDSIEPTEEWLALYHTVSDKLGKMGLDIQHAWKKKLQDQ